MQNHQFDLRAGDCIRLGDYKVTLLEIDSDGQAVLEIEGPDDDYQLEPAEVLSGELEPEPVCV